MSIQLTLANATLRATALFDRRSPAAWFAALQPERAEAPPPQRLLRAARCEPLDIAGRRVLRLTPSAGASGIHLIYLHGGAYVHPLSPLQWSAVQELMKLTSATVWVPSYALAPEHTVQDAIPFLDAVYARVDEAAGAGPLVLVGDSAGGGLAVAQAIRVRDAGLRPAQRLLLFSPWVEAGMGSPAAAQRRHLDAMLSIERLTLAGRAWAGARPVQDPQVSPVNDTLAGLPQMMISVGERELFLPDITAFAAKAQAAGTEVHTTVIPGGFHDVGFVARLPEAKDVLRRSVTGLDLGRQGPPHHPYVGRDCP